MMSQKTPIDDLSFIESYRVLEPILGQLQAFSGHQVISILSRATTAELLAFAHLLEGHELQRLIQVFLTQDDDEFHLVDRKAIIGFLRRTDFALMVMDVVSDLKARYLVLVPVQNELMLSLEDKVYFSEWVEACHSKTLAPKALADIEHKITWMLQELDEAIESEAIARLVQTYPDNHLFSLMGNFRSPDNLKAAIQAIFKTDEFREALFKGLYEADFYQFLARNHTTIGFAEYLSRHFEQPWFSKGLELFSGFAQAHHCEHFLSDALMMIAREESSSYPKILSELLGSVRNAEILLHAFFQDKGESPVQNHQHTELAKVSACFGSTQLMELVEILNKSDHWEHNAQYKILLHFLHQNFTGFFNPKELSQQGDSFWQIAHLQQLSVFLNSHSGKPYVYDRHGQVGQRLFAELLLRCAQLGSTAVFYTDEGLNSSLLRLTMSRTFLMELIDRFWVPDAVKEHFVDDKVRISALFDGPQLKPMDLNEDPLLVDWHQFMQHYKKLPVICVYLMYYAGKKQDAAQLLHDYFEVFASKEEYLCSVTQLMRVFPQRKVSVLIFEVLQEQLIDNPSLLKSRALNDMAVLYRQIHPDKKSVFNHAVLDLIQYFGANRHYHLVQKCCELFGRDGAADKRIKTLLHKAAKEARVESRLEDFKSSPYFNWITSLYRLWYYGSAGVRHMSQLVRGCDDSSTNHEMIEAPEWINRPASLGCNDKSTDFRRRKNQFIALLSTVSKSSVHGGQEVSSPSFAYEFFAKAQDENNRHMTKDVPMDTNMVN